jgi:hypothetical protein
MIPSDVLEKALNNTTLATRMGAVEQKVQSAVAGASDGTVAAQQLSEYRATPDFPKTKLPEVDKLYEAVSDADWSESVVGDEHWEVVVQRVKQDGTLDADSEVTKSAVGVEEDGAPLVTGDRCFELVTADGKRVVVGWKDLAGSGGASLDHSFKPVRTSATEFSITKGRIRVGSEVASTALPGTATGLLIGTSYYIKVDWSSTNFRAPLVSWESGTAPANTDTTMHFQIIEFTSTTWESLIRRQTSDLHIPNYPIPELTAATPALMVFNGTSLVWVSATEDYSVFQRKADDSLGFDYVRVMP